MNRVQYITILDHCKKGEFQLALELIHQHLENDIGIKLLVNCCHSCLDSEKNICTETLYKLLKFIVPTIRKPNELELVSYIQSIYHILNLFIKKDSLNIITQMEDILLPAFLPINLSKKLRHTYNSITVILYNVVAGYAVEKDRSKNEIMLKISLLVSKISSVVLEPLEALNRAYKSFTNLVCLKITVDEEKEYFKEVLLLCIGTYNGQSKEEYFKIILSFSSIILNNILRTFDFQKAWDFFQAISDIFKEKSVQVEFMCLYQVLKSCLIMSPIKIGNENEELIKCIESLNTLEEILGESDAQQKLREKLFIMLKNVTCYYQTRRNEWTAMPDKLQLDIMHFIAGITEVYHDQSLSSLQIILHLMEAQLTQKSNTPLKYHKECLQILNMFSNQMISLKEHKVETWKNLWNTLGVKAYNFGVSLWRKTNTNTAALLYLNFLLKLYIKLETKNSLPVLKQPTLSSCLRVICEMNSKDPRKYLMHIALAIVLCPISKESMINDWVKLKHSEREKKAAGFEEIQQVTLVSALELLQEESPSYKDILKDYDKLQLLKFELEQYKRKWKSKIPIMSALKELHTFPDIEKKAEIIVDVFRDCEMPLHDDCLVILEDILNSYEVEHTENIKSRLYLGVLHYITYKYSITQMIAKNAEDMAKMSIVVPAFESGIPPNTKEECDVVSVYESSALEKYLKKLNYLDESLAIFLSVVPELNGTCEMGCLTTSQLYDLLLQISHEYRLLQHRLRCLQASELALEFAQFQNNIVGIVQMTGFIIEFSDLSTKYLKNIVQKADSLLESMEFSEIENLKVVMIYYICKSKALFSCDLRESYKAFKSCMDLIGSRKDSEQGFVTVKSQLHLLNFKFTTLPCELEIENHKDNTLLDVHTAAEIIFKEYSLEQSVPGNSYDISILLDANEELIKLYHLMRCPRDVYAYAREILLLCQKLVLPLRCATFLMYLAHADLRTNALADCQVKLDGMANILCLYAAVESESEDELPRHSKELSPSSPKMEIESFRLPTVTTHGIVCDCFYCICYEYQILVLEKTRLSALLNVKQGNNSVAQAYFKGALDLYQHYSLHTISNTRKFAGIIRCYVPDFHKEFLMSYGFILLNFSSHLDRNDKKVEAFDMNEKLINVLLEVKSDFVYLYNEALSQKCVFLTESLCCEPLREIENTMEYLTINDVPDLSTTPESKYTKISFPVKCITPESTPQIQKFNKRLVFNLSPSEDSSENIKSTVSKKRAQKSCTKTPVSKIQIYTEASEKKSTRKTRCQNLYVPSTSKKKFAGTFSIPDDLENELKNRTRLLTEKLKQSSKDIESKLDKSRRLPVKKNLLNELVESGDEQSTSKYGAVRKSTRNKK